MRTHSYLTFSITKPSLTLYTLPYTFWIMNTAITKIYYFLKINITRKRNMVNFLNHKALHLIHQIKYFSYLNHMNYLKEIIPCHYFNYKIFMNSNNLNYYLKIFIIFLFSYFIPIYYCC